MGNKEIIGKLRDHSRYIQSTLEPNSSVAEKLDDEGLLEDFINIAKDLQKAYDILSEYDEGSIGWSVDDFKTQAHAVYGDNWHNVLNELMFPTALRIMIQKHDADIGITWDTIEYYLEQYCKY